MARKTEAELAAQRRYREKNRELLRAKGRVYMEQRRREEGQAIRGSKEWLAKRGPEHYPKGETHGNWKGAQASYSALHHWIARWGAKVGICSTCGSQPKARGLRKLGTEWHNLSGEYRRELSDWVELCSTCHKREEVGSRG